MMNNLAFRSAILSLLALLTTAFVNAQSRPSHSSTIAIVDESGAPFPNVLVIVKSLDSGREELRALTNSAGKVPPVSLRDELYRIITTCPYGLCKTSVTEVLGQSIPPELMLAASVKPSDADGELIGSPTVWVVIEDPTGRPLSDFKFLVRDSSATWEHWYSTGTSGTAEIELPAETSVLVAIVDDRVTHIKISSPCKGNSKSLCVQVPQDSPVRVRAK